MGLSERPEHDLTPTEDPSQGCLRISEGLLFPLQADHGRLPLPAGRKSRLRRTTLREQPVSPEGGDTFRICVYSASQICMRNVLPGGCNNKTGRGYGVAAI